MANADQIQMVANFYRSNAWKFFMLKGTRTWWWSRQSQKPMAEMGEHSTWTANAFGQLVDEDLQGAWWNAKAEAGFSKISQFEDVVLKQLEVAD